MLPFRVKSLRKFLFCTLSIGSLLTLVLYRILFWPDAKGKFSSLKISFEDDFENTFSVLISAGRDGISEEATIAVIDNRNDIGDDDKLVRVAVGGGITSALLSTDSVDNSTVANLFEVLSPFLKSFCSTASAHGYAYDFYFAYDWYDRLFDDKRLLRSFVDSFVNRSRLSCPDLRLSLNMVRCQHVRSPAWAQNDAMIEAYLDGADYFYRVNDDTLFLTRNWTATFTRELARFRPPNFGVVGPNHTGGEDSILTYDFVHRTHVDAFGFYYPRRFTDWFADTWITSVYPPGNTLKVSSVRVRHVMSLGTRYTPDMSRRDGFDDLVLESKKLLERYEFSLLNPVARDPKKVVSMSLHGKSPGLSMGAIRNAQLFPVTFPGWTLRFYAYYKKEEEEEEEKKSGADRPFEELSVPSRIVKCLRRLGAQVVLVDPKSTELRPGLWSYLAAEDEEIDHFFIRSALHRVTSRDRQAVEEFIRESRSNGNGSVIAFHCMRDRASHLNTSVVPDLWGGSPRALRDIFGVGGFQRRVAALTSRNESEESALNELLWNDHRDRFLCHDSLSCSQRFPSFVRFANHSTPAKIEDFLAVEYDRHQNPLNFSLALELQVRSIEQEICQNLNPRQLQ